MKNDLIRPEVAHAINRVPGRLFALRVPPAPWASGVFANQTWASTSRPVKGYDKDSTLTVEMRFDDNCRNGAMSFAITGSVRTPGRGEVAGGCLHEDIAQTFPELAPLIKWHLCATDGPMHYLANTVYLAGDRDHNGKRKGEPFRFNGFVYFGTSPVGHSIGDKFAQFIKSRMTGDGETYTTNLEMGEFRVVGIAHDRDPKTYGTHYTLAGFAERWHDCPFREEHTAQEWAKALNTVGARFVRVPVAFSVGKDRELDNARSAAIWPEATDEQLASEPAQLREMLTARLPALLAEFRTAMESAGFVWEAPARSEG